MKQAPQLKFSARGSAMVVLAILCGIALTSGCLLTLAFMPFIHKRAVCLTTRHIIAAAPASTADVRAERDHSRAQFAVAIRGLENSVQKLKTKCAGQAAGVGREAAKIHRLEAELKKRTGQSAEIGRQGGEIQRLEAELKKRASHTVELGRQAAEIHRLEAELKKHANQSAELARQTAEIHRLEAELKKRAALISVLRVREQAQHAVT